MSTHLRRRGWRQNNDEHGNPFRGLPPDALHREDAGVWLALVDAFCTALRTHFPSQRRKARRGADGSSTGEEDESHSEKIDEINERMSRLAIFGRWESFNIPCQGEYLPEHTNVQVRQRPLTTPCDSRIRVG